MRLRKSSAVRPAAVLALLVCSGCGGGGDSAAPPAATQGPTRVNTSIQAASGYTRFTYPVSGQLGVDATHVIEWQSVSGAGSYQLQVGTAPETGDVFDSGIVTTTSLSVPQLPASGTLYARVRVIKQGASTSLPAGDFPWATYLTFSMDTGVTGADFTYPVAGGSFDADTPMTWQADALAQGYQLTITNPADGGKVLLDTGQIRSLTRVVAGLPLGVPLTASLRTFYAQGVTRTHTLSFTTTSGTTSTAGMLALARSLAGTVRQMADGDNQPRDLTPLATMTLAMDDGSSDCVDYAATLLAEFVDSGLPLTVRTRDVCFNPPDCHELVEVFDPDTKGWVNLDPTFGLYVLGSGGVAASVDEISATVRAGAPSTLGFTYLTPAGSVYAHGYYLDYPLLFLQVYKTGSTTEFEQPVPALEPYLDFVGSSVDGPPSNLYTIQCAAGSSSANANWDGTQKQHPCTNGFTEIFWGFAVQLVPGDSSATAIWKPHRFAF